MADPLRLVLLTFPQHWDGKGTLTLNVVLIPAVDPLPGPLIGASTPSFANGAPSFTVIVDKGLAAPPASTGPFAIPLTPTILSPPASPAATFATLQRAVTASGANSRRPPGHLHHPHPQGASAFLFCRWRCAAGWRHHHD